VTFEEDPWEVDWDTAEDAAEDAAASLAEKEGDTAEDALEEDDYLDTIMQSVSEGNDEDEWEVDRIAAEEDAYLATFMDEHARRPPRRTESNGTPEPSERPHRAQRRWWAEKANSKQPAKKNAAPRTSRHCPNPKCKKKVRATASYCKSCGIRLDNYCPNPKCNKRVQKTANYCDGCGHQLKS
jgi:hypothetical protein